MPGLAAWHLRNRAPAWSPHSSAHSAPRRPDSGSGQRSFASSGSIFWPELRSIRTLCVLLDISVEGVVGSKSQKRAIRNYRNRLQKRGMARFEVLGLDGDRDLIRSLARRRAEDGPDASRLRAAVTRTISADPHRKGG